MDRVTHQSPRQRGYGSTSSLRNDSLKHRRKHKRKEGGTKPRNKAARLWRTVRPGGADCPHGPRELSGLLPRTVRTCTTDRPTLSRRLSVKANRTSGSEPRKTDRQRGARGPSKTSSNQNRSNAKPSKNMKNTRRTLLSRTVRHLLADCAHLTDRGKNCSTPMVNSPNSSPDLQTVEAVETKVWGHDMRQPRMLYPKNFAS
jgi:hypothetical protein